MKPTEILNALMSGTQVKVSDKFFKDIYEPYKDKPTVNAFSIYQIEQGTVSLYNDITEEVYYDVLFSDLLIL